MPVSAMNIKTAIDISLERIRNNIAVFAEQFPYVGEGNAYRLGNNDHWMSSFWTGELWLSYMMTGDATYRDAAQRHLASFRHRLQNNVDISHDVGFLYSLSARAEWQLTGNEAAHQLALDAADALMGRFHEKGSYIQAWGAVGDPDEGGRFIIDCMMNIPLLYWAGHRTGDQRYIDVANRHASTNMNYIVREDGSSAHTFFMNQVTGEPIGQRTHQGYADDSLWSRGQAWAINGFAIAYDWTRNDAFLQTARRTADRYLAEISTDYVPLWDFRLPDGANPIRDASANAISAMGLLRLARLIDEVEVSRYYADQAEKLMDALLQVAFDTAVENIEGLLKDSTYNARNPKYSEHYTLFGDYFFLEALLHLDGKLIEFWGRP